MGACGGTSQMSNVQLLAPGGLTSGLVQTAYGNYQVDSNGFVSVDTRVSGDLLKAGFALAPHISGSQTISTDGLTVTRIPLSSGMNGDGSALAAAAGAGVFGLVPNGTTSFGLKGESAVSNTKTDTALFEVVLPPTYIAGSNVALIANANYAGAGTAGASKSLTLTAYKIGDDSTDGANLIATAAATLTTTAADNSFVITGTTLKPGDRLLIKAVMVLQETAASSIIGAINSLRLF